MSEANGGRPADKLILVVDDDPGIVMMLKESVKFEGFRVDEAMDGEEALDKIEKLKPDLVLLDLMLPRYGGFEVIEELKAGPRAATPVVVITGRFGDSETAAKLRGEPSVAAFLDKPVKPAELGGILHRILKTRPERPARK
jgi:CheY-like chemotaxis protein